MEECQELKFLMKLEFIKMMCNASQCIQPFTKVVMIRMLLIAFDLIRRHIFITTPKNPRELLLNS